MFFLITSFNTFFNDYPKIQEYSNFKYSLIHNDYEIKNIFFLNLISLLEHGGAIYANSINLRLLIENCMFHQCKTMGSFNGGAIYIIFSQAGGVFLNKICGSYCNVSSTSQFQFGIISCPINKTLFCQYLSINKCDSISGVIFKFNRGNQTNNNYNSSLNFVSVGSGIFFQSPNYVNSIFMTISNTKDTNERCIFLWVEPGIGIIQYCNIVNTNQGTGVNANLIVNRDMISNIENCIFYNNTTPVMFFIDSGSLTLKNCWSLRYDFTKIPITSINNFLLLTNSFKIFHFKSFYCFAENLYSENYYTYNLMKNFSFKFIFFMFFLF